MDLAAQRKFLNNKMNKSAFLTPKIDVLDNFLINFVENSKIPQIPYMERQIFKFYIYGDSMYIYILGWTESPFGDFDKFGRRKSAVTFF